MCINTQRIHTRTPSEAKEMAKKVSQYTNPIAHNPLRPEDITGTLQNKGAIPKVEPYRCQQHSVPPIPRDCVGLRYGGCDF